MALWPPPVIAGETNFFLDYAKAHQIKLPIDVDARLAQMMYIGGPEASIHNTLSVCCEGTESLRAGP
jgi:hypothetical protein